MNLVEILRQRAGKCPDAAAIVDMSEGSQKARTITFRELDELSARAAGTLKGEGLKPGDTALMFQPMSADLYISLLAVLRAGMTAMFIDPSTGIAAIRGQCRRYSPVALIATPKAHLLQIVAPEMRGIPHKFTMGRAFPGAKSLMRDGKHVEPMNIPVPRENDDPALLTFTSGSTGNPKPACRSHGFVHAQYQALRGNILLSPGEVDVTTLPLFLLANLAAGVTSVIPNVDLRSPGKVSPEILVANIREHSVTRTAASPALLERLADYCLSEEITLVELKKIFTGGAPVFPRVLDKLQKIAPNARVFAVYGSTEAEPITHIELDQLNQNDLEKMYSGGGLLTGKPIDEITVRVLKNRWQDKIGNISRDEFESLSQNANEVGEIVVTGDHVLSGYLNGDGDDETKLRVDNTIWHRTGDAGYLDESGRLWLLGRCGSEVSRPSGNLYPFSVECAASKFQSINRSALMEDNHQCILALEGDGKCSDLSHLQQSLSWAGIDSIRYVPHIPVDARHNAKIDYTKLRSILRNG